MYPGQHPAIINRALWDRVQLQLKYNVQGERRRPRVTSTSLLIGLVYDETAICLLHPMLPREPDAIATMSRAL